MTRRPPLLVRENPYLLSGEVEVAAVRSHPITLLRPFTVFIGVPILVGAVTERLPAGSGFASFLWLLALVAVAYFVLAFLEWVQGQFIVTNRRVLLVSGLFTRRVAMLPLRKVTDMSYERPVVGRLLGYGTFVMESAGQEQALRRVPFIPDPDHVYRTICDEVFETPSGGE